MILKKCLLELKSRELSIPFMNNTISYLIEKYDDDQLLHLLSNGIKLDQQTILQYIQNIGWKCYNNNGYNQHCQIIEKQLNNTLLLNNTIGSSWYIPSLEYEINDLKLESDKLKINFDKLLDCINNSIVEGTLITLNKNIWEELENTDSQYNLTLDQIKAISNNSKKVNNILNNLINGTSQEAPIILFRENEKPYLLTGNVRLMLCKLLNYIPTILPVYYL